MRHRGAILVDAPHACAWLPTADEIIQAVAAPAPIILTVRGDAHPPVSLVVEAPAAG